MRLTTVTLLVCSTLLLVQLPAQQKKQQPKKGTEQAPLISVPKEALNPPALEVPKPIDPRVRPQISELAEYEFPATKKRRSRTGSRFTSSKITANQRSAFGFRSVPATPTTVPNLGLHR